MNNYELDFKKIAKTDYCNTPEYLQFVNHNRLPRDYYEVNELQRHDR